MADARDRQRAATVEDYAAVDAMMRQDLEHYSNALVRIQDKDGKLVPFAWNRAQRELHRILERQREATGKVRAVILKARQLGIGVPHDLSIIGIDDHPLAETLGITTLAQRPGAQGGRAVELLLELALDLEGQGVFARDTDAAGKPWQRVAPCLSAFVNGPSVGGLGEEDAREGSVI